VRRSSSASEVTGKLEDRLVPDLETTIAVTNKASKDILGKHVGDQDVEGTSVEIGASADITLSGVLLDVIVAAVANEVGGSVLSGILGDEVVQVSFHVAAGEGHVDTIGIFERDWVRLLVLQSSNGPTMADALPASIGGRSPLPFSADRGIVITTHENVIFFSRGELNKFSGAHGLKLLFCVEGVVEVVGSTGSPTNSNTRLI